MSSRTFPLEQLKEWYITEDPVYENEEDTGRRWYNEVELVFRAPDDGLTYRIYYPRGKTENQEVYWHEEFYDEVLAERVEPVTKLVEVTTWEEVDG
jgi:hypothetical protein